MQQVHELKVVHKGKKIIVVSEGVLKEGIINDTFNDLIRIRFYVLGVFFYHRWYFLNDPDVILSF